MLFTCGNHTKTTVESLRKEAFLSILIQLLCICLSESLKVANFYVSHLVGLEPFFKKWFSKQFRRDLLFRHDILRPSFCLVV